MSTRFYRLFVGAALLITMAACQGNQSMSEAPMASHGDDMSSETHGDDMSSEMMTDDHDAMTMAMGDPVFKGTFQKAEYDGSGGSFAIHKDGDQTMLRLSEDFATNAGAPDLYVVIGNTANPIAGKALPYPLAADEYKTVDVLKAASGAQDYEIPANIDLSEDSSVIIWCKQFNATMGYAPLQAAAMH